MMPKVTKAKPGARRVIDLPDWRLPDLPHVPATPEPSKAQARKHAKVRGTEARRVRRRGSRIRTGSHPLKVLDNKMLVGEAGTEKALWPVIDFLYPNLVEAAAQPFQLDISIFGVAHRWTPDALLTFPNDQLIIEVKPLRELQPVEPEDPLDEPENPFGDDLPDGITPTQYARARIKAWEDAAAAQGCRFLAISEAEVRLEPRFYNAQIWHRSNGSRMPPDIRDAAIEHLANSPAELTIGELAPAFGTYRGSALLFACELDRLGYLCLDRGDFFSPRTRLTNRLAAKPT